MSEYGILSLFLAYSPDSYMIYLDCDLTTTLKVEVQSHIPATSIYLIEYGDPIVETLHSSTRAKKLLLASHGYIVDLARSHVRKYCLLEVHALTSAPLRTPLLHHRITTTHTISNMHLC
jgi:hypothetical protein